MIYKDWTIVVTNIEERKDGKAVYVEITKVARTESKVFTGIISKEGLQIAVKAWIDSLSTQDTVTTDIVLDFTDPTPVTPTLTPAELAKKEFEKDRALLASLMELVRDGVFTGTETQIVNLRTKVKSAFKVEYLN
jgi:hypothetical protein